MRIKKHKISLGVGINDAEYRVLVTEEGKQKFCPIYKKWYSMLSRCYHKKGKVYELYGARGSYMCDEWLKFSNFKLWIESKQWHPSLHLDKDILVRGNLEYSPDKCCLVPGYINQLLAFKSGRNASNFMGVVYFKPSPDMHAQALTKPWMSTRSKINNASSYGGLFSTAEEAHAKWQADKADSIEFAINRWATDPKYSIYFDTKVAEALTSRVWELRISSHNGTITEKL
jgi:hypothetical protein